MFYSRSYPASTCTAIGGTRALTTNRCARAPELTEKIVGVVWEMGGGGGSRLDWCRLSTVSVETKPLT